MRVMFKDQRSGTLLFVGQTTPNRANSTHMYPQVVVPQIDPQAHVQIDEGIYSVVNVRHRLTRREIVVTLELMGGKPATEVLGVPETHVEEEA